MFGLPELPQLPALKKFDAGSLPGSISGVLSAPSKAVSSAIFGNVDPARLAAFLVGLICVAGALFLFKPTSEIVTNAAKAAATAAA